MTGSYVFIGGVDVSRACLEALCDIGRPPALAIGYDPSRADASGFADLGAVCSRHGVELLRTADVNSTEVLGAVSAKRPSVLLVVGWSQLLRPPLLDLPAQGAVGIHPTKLPIGRGRAPIPWTILKGLRETASTMFFLTPGVDDGDVVDAIELAVDEREDAGTLYAKHRAAHVALVTRNIDLLVDGRAPRTPQDPSHATYWERRRPEDGRIDPSRSADEVDRLVRAVTRPFPGAFLQHGTSRTTIWRSAPLNRDVSGEPGQIVQLQGAKILVCGQGAIEILECERSPGVVGSSVTT